MLETGDSGAIKKQKRLLSKKDKVIAILILAILMVSIILAFVFRENIEVINTINRYSLIGVLAISLVACSPISMTAIPIPYLLVIFTLPTVLADQWGIFAPIWVGVAAAFGATMGQALTFMIGYGSRNVSENLFSKISEKAYNKAVTWIKRFGNTAVFAISAIPNPVHLPITLALGAAKFSPRNWVLLSLAGNLVKCMAIAFAGYFGVAFILHLLGS
jgi:membrane protein DedA with SNARE-associated domain